MALHLEEPLDESTRNDGAPPLRIDELATAVNSGKYLRRQQCWMDSKRSDINFGNIGLENMSARKIKWSYTEQSFTNAREGWSEGRRVSVIQRENIAHQRPVRKFAIRTDKR